MTNSHTGILLVNLGTPDSPEPKDVYRYLIEFLTDERVIDVPWWKRQFLVRAVIVPLRYKTSAKAYKEIWMEEGSPLYVYGKRLQKNLQKELGDTFCVELGMRYQNPSIEVALQSLLLKDISKIIVVPLFPQYASATTGSVQQKVMSILSRQEVIPEVLFIESYFNHPALIDAFCAMGNKYPLQDYDRVIFSFHGLPNRQLFKADRNGHCLANKKCCEVMNAKNRTCYSAQCYATAQAIAKKMQIPSEQYSVSFQSRLGKEPWLEPSTLRTLLECAGRGEKKVLVFCPSFVCDCLETLYEIGVEYKNEFLKKGGELLTLVEGLNDQTIWVDGLKKIILEKLGQNENIPCAPFMIKNEKSILITDEALLSYNHQGLIPAPNEIEEDFLLRAKQALDLRKTLEKSEEGVLPFTSDSSVSNEVLHEAFPLTKKLFDVEPAWLPLFFSNYHMTLWHGACTWIFQFQEEGPKAAFLQLRKAFAFQDRYLKIYRRDEVIAHEIAHVGRMAFNEKCFEELIAYRTSSSVVRRWIGSMIESAWEGLLFVGIVTMLILLDFYLLMSGNLESYEWAMQLKFIPVALLSIGVIRVFSRQRVYKRCLTNLQKIVDKKKKAEFITYRLTDKEIKSFAKMPPEKILEYAWKESKISLRWRLICLAYFSNI